MNEDTWELYWYVTEGSGEMRIVHDGMVVGTVKPGPGINVFTEDELAARDEKVARLTLEKASDMIRDCAVSHASAVGERFRRGLTYAAGVVDPRKPSVR